MLGRVSSIYVLRSMCEVRGGTGVRSTDGVRYDVDFCYGLMLYDTYVILLCCRTFTIRDAMLSDVYVMLWYVLSQYLNIFLLVIFHFISNLN
jgi:hypothetical protein